MFLPQRLPGQEWLGVVVAIPEPWVTQLTNLRLRLGDLAGSRIPAHITHAGRPRRAPGSH